MQMSPPSATSYSGAGGGNGGAGFRAKPGHCNGTLNQPDTHSNRYGHKQSFIYRLGKKIDRKLEFFKENGKRIQGKNSRFRNVIQPV